MPAKNDKLHAVLERIKPYWYAQENENGDEIELTEVNQRNVSLETPIIVAAQHLNPEDIQALVENGAEIDAQSGSEQRDSALHIACLMGRFDNVNKLIELGANRNLVNGIGKTPVDYCQRHGHGRSVLL